MIEETRDPQGLFLGNRGIFGLVRTSMSIGKVTYLTEL